MGSGQSAISIQSAGGEVHCLVGIHHGGGNTSDYLGEFIMRKLNEVGIRCEYCQSMNSAEVKKLVLFLINKDYNEWADENNDLLQNILSKEDVAFLPIVIDDELRNPSIWSSALKLIDRFYVDMVPNEAESGMPPADVVRQLQEKVQMMSGLTLSKYHISCHGDPNWRSHVEKGEFFLDNGFHIDSGSCGGGGVFEAFDVPVPGMTKIEFNNDHNTVTFWASTKKTHINQYEWRIFHVKGSNKMLVTSRRDDTAPGWSLKELFYAPGIPSKGGTEGHHVLQGEVVKFHVFNSHNWSNGNHRFVVNTHEFLRSRGILSWIDEEQLNDVDPILEQLDKGIQSCAIVVVYITQAYVDKVSGENDFDNCKREMMIYKKRHEEGEAKLVFAITSDALNYTHLKDPNNWGALTCLVRDNPVVDITEGFDALNATVMGMLGLKPALYYITMKEWQSYVNKGSYYTEKGFKTSGSCGANGVFEAYEEEAPGLIKIEVDGATFFASPEKVSVLQLEWRCYTYQHQKYLVTSNRRDMAPGWTFLKSFYARGRPSNGCDQEATLLE